MSPHDTAEGMTIPHSETQITESKKECTRADTRSTRRLVDWSDTVEDQPTEEAVLQISGVGQWFLEGWIGDHAVNFLVDSVSAVTALSCKFYQTVIIQNSYIHSSWDIVRFHHVPRRCYIVPHGQWMAG